MLLNYIPDAWMLYIIYVICVLRSSCQVNTTSEIVMIASVGEKSIIRISRMVVFINCMLENSGASRKPQKECELLDRGLSRKDNGIYIS